MNTPNWQHHSKKDQKRKLKPQAMRSRREALRHFKKSHVTSRKRGVSWYYGHIRNEPHVRLPRNQVTTGKTPCD